MEEAPVLDVSSDNADKNNDNADDNSDVMVPGYNSFKDYISEGYKVVMEAVKASGSLPCGRNYHFYSTYTDFQSVMKAKGSHLQDILDSLLTSQGIERSVKEALLEDALDVMMIMNDKMLERSCLSMDVMEGIRTGLAKLMPDMSPISGSWNKQTEDRSQSVNLTLSRNIPRPQFVFTKKVDNTNTPWVPGIKEKPNAIKPLAILTEITDDGDECYSHPYDYELDMWTVRDERLARVGAKRPPPLEDTPFEYIDTVSGLDDLMTDLKQQTTIAVDLEHHSYRSFLGFTCLMQISTPCKDYAVDTLSLRDHLHLLNSVFTDPSILKVFHGADSDILWLQRDFNIYVVNMFDTHQAAKLLGYPKLSLAFLLAQICRINANKHFQLFDWRTRPLPEPALKYAREDTHYLLFIYQALSNQLLDKDNGSTSLLKAAYERSKQICKKRFMKPLVDADSFMTVYRKSKRLFDNRQLFALKGLYLWRDKTAREQDESTGYVLPDHMMLHMCETLPREAQGILACCNPIPPFVKSNLLELHFIINQAKEQPLTKVVPEKNPAPVASVEALTGAAERRMLDQWYHQSDDAKEGLPTLLDGSLPSTLLTELDDLQLTKPSITIFQEEEVSSSEGVSMPSESVQFVSPYQRYLKVLPYVVQLEQEEREREERYHKDKLEASRKQLKQAMEIKSLQESGLIKLKEEEKEDVTTLRFQVQRDRKRKSDGKAESSPVKMERLEEVAVKEEQTHKQNSLSEPTSAALWKQLKAARHKKEKEAVYSEKQFVPYDYSKVDFSKFHSSKHEGFKGKGKRSNPVSHKSIPPSKKKKKGKW